MGAFLLDTQMADAELTAKLKLDAEEFERKVKSSTQAAEELAKRVGDSASSLNKVLPNVQTK